MKIKNTRIALKIISESNFENIYKDGRIATSKIFPESSRSLDIVRKTTEVLDKFSDLLDEEDIKAIDDAIIQFTKTKITCHIREKLNSIYSFEIFDNIENAQLSNTKSILSKKLKKIIKPFLIAEKIATKEIVGQISSQSDEITQEAIKTLDLLENIKLKAIDSESLISNSKSLFSNFLNRQESEIQNLISTKSNEINRLTTNIKEEITKAEENQDQKIQSAIESLKEEIKSHASDLKEIAINELEPTKKEAIKILTDVKNLKDKTQELIGEISSGASAKHYEDAYKGEMRTRLIWQAFSIAGFIAIAVIISKTASQLLGISSAELTSHDIFSFSIRATSIFMAVFFITYCSKQATKHHELEKFNRQMRFELLTLDTYLSTLSDQGQRESAKIQLKENFFGQSQKLMSDPSKTEVSQTITGEIKGILDSLVKVIETGKGNEK